MRDDEPHGRHDRSLQMSVRQWLVTAASEPVVQRALGYALGVGAILIAINHGDALLAGHVDATRLLKMGLTVLVPYCVSTASSVGAILSRPPCEDGGRSAPEGEAE